MTRKAQKGEVEGQDGYFVKKEVLERMRANGGLIRMLADGKEASGLAWEELQRRASQGLHVALGLGP